MQKNKNNFDDIRVVLAIFVFISHLWALTENHYFLFLANIFDANFAVKGFFCISGYLVTKSYISSSSIYDYANKRILRIYPAYIGVIVFCIIIGLLTSSLRFVDLIGSKEIYRYLIFNSIFLNFLQPDLPGVFEGNHFEVLNGSLWTIKVEAMLYICVPFLVYFLKRFGWKFLSTIVVVSIIWSFYFEFISKSLYGPEISRQFPGQLSYFSIGAMYAFRPNWKNMFKWVSFASLPLLLIISNPYWRSIINPIAFSSIVLYLCTMNYKLPNISKFGDISYGIYLYHFPIIQLCIYKKLFDRNIFIGLVISALFTFLAALLSWNYLEKPLLRRNSYYIKSQVA